MKKAALPPKTVLLAAGGAIVVAALALVAALTFASAHAPAGSARDAARGYTDKVTVPMYAPNQFRPSVPRPVKLPPMIRSSGACKVAMDKVRDFLDANPSGLTLSAPKAQQLSVLMRGVDPAVSPDAVCSDGLAQKFRLQELEPWQTWQPPIPAAKH